MKILKNAIIAGTLAFATLNVATAAVLNLDIATDGTLMGASGVDVGGTLYDVSFADGILNDTAISAFTTEDGARAASRALLEQVLLRFDEYDDLSVNTNGCTSTFSCEIVTPYRVDYDADNDQFLLRSISLLNFARPADATTDISRFSFILGRNTDSNGRTIATWNAIAAVPEPETYAMFLAGLGLLGAVSRRRKQKAAV